MDFKLLLIKSKIWLSKFFILKLYYNLSNRKSEIGIQFNKYLVSDRTDAVVEGFPRSGNTWLTEFMRYKTNLTIASHIHYPFMIRDGIRHNIPVYLVVRHPLDSISSLMVRDNSFTLEAALYYYRSFHIDIFKFIHEIRVIRFEKVTQELDILSREMNNDHNGIEIDKSEIPVFKEHLTLLEKSRYKGHEAANKIGLPDELRIDKKAQLKKKIKNHFKYAETVKIYQQIIEYAR